MLTLLKLERAYKSLKKDQGFSRTDTQVLLYLLKHGNHRTSMYMMNEDLHIDKSLLTRRVKKLNEDGLLEKGTMNRKVNIQLTFKGEERAREINNLMRRVFK